MPPNGMRTSSGAIDHKLGTPTAVFLDPAAAEAEKPMPTHSGHARKTPSLESAREVRWTDINPG